jgi:hypothetical protein
MGCTAGGWGLISTGAEVFLFSNGCPIQWLQQALSVGLKLSGCEDDRPLATN